MKRHINIYNVTFSFCACIFLTFVKCSSRNAKSDNGVIQMLNLAGTNRSQLESVIKHFSINLKDSLKLRAAVFLIGNMRDKYSIQGPGYRRFLLYLDSLGDQNQSTSEYQRAITDYYDTCHSLLGSNNKIVLDCNTISSSFLIQHINQRFSVFQRCSWRNKISFQTFCEFILPYRVGNEWINFDQSPLGADSTLYHFLDLPLRTSADSMLGRLSKKPMPLMPFPDNLPTFNLEDGLKLKAGSCEESSQLAVQIFRSMGMPVAYDYTPQWPHRRSAHSWAALLGYDAPLDFEGVTAHKVGEHLLVSTGNRLSKVYRRMFDVQIERAKLAQTGEDLPPIFKRENEKDVTEQYTSTTTLTLPNINTDSKLAFLCTFDNENWIPAAVGFQAGQTVKFEKVGTSVVYLPMKYKEGFLVPFSDPVLVDSIGLITLLKSNTSRNQNVTVTRKYPIFDWWDSRTLDLRNAKFILGRKNSRKKDSEFQAYRVPGKTTMKFYHINIHSKNSYDYLKFAAADSSYGDIAEISVLDKANHEIQGIVSSKSETDADHTPQKAFDHLNITFFQGLRSLNNSIIYSFNRPTKVGRIIFLPRNDDNFINQGEDYELEYFSSTGWKSSGVEVGSFSGSLTYKNVPTDALYLLHNRTKGSEERIFIYKDNRQIWY